MRRALLLGLATVLLGAGPPARAETGEPPAALRRFALLVGSNDGGPGRARLRYADTDARALAGVLDRLGGLREGDRVLLLGPSPADLDRAVDDLGARLAAARGPGRRIELLVYYSGHSDEEGLLLGPRRLAYGDLRAAISRLGADLSIVILDSCSAGAFTRQKGGARRPPFLADTSVRVRGHAFLASSSASEAAQESDRIGGSFFTHFLLSGLRGAADVSGDGRVTLNEAYNFAFSETLARTERTLAGAQHPAYDIQLAGTGDVVMTDLRDPSAALTLPKDLRGRVFVRDGAGTLQAELTKVPGVGVSLALEPGPYQVTVERDGRLWVAKVTLPGGGAQALPPEALVEVAGERTARRGGAAGPIVPFNLALFHPLSINARYGPDAINYLSLNVIAGRAGALRGLEIGMVTNWQSGDASGLQVSGGLNLLGGSVRGVQLSMGANIIAGDVMGVQIGGAGNLVRGDAAGVQAGAFNLVRGSFRGLQIGAGASVTRGPLHGVQFGGVLSQAPVVYGVQLGLLNIGGDVEGGQIGLINYARSVRGLQLGLINIARSVRGGSIGLLSLVRDGTHTLEVYGGDVMPFNVGTKLGGRRAYGIVGLGIDPLGDRPRWSLGLGLGGHIPLWPLRPLRPPGSPRLPERLFLEIDLLSHAVQPDITRFDSEHVRVVTELRVLLGWQIVRWLAAFAGPTVHVSLSDDPCCAGAVSALSEGERLWQVDRFALRLGPGFVAGLRAF